MGRKLRQGDPWMPGFRYGALLPPLSLNLLVRDVARAVAFYQQVFAAEVHYHDIDFGAAHVGPVEVMLHADHTHEGHPWHALLQTDTPRGVGLQLRVLGMEPDAVETRRACRRGAHCGPYGGQGSWLARGIGARPRRLRMGGGCVGSSGQRPPWPASHTLDPGQNLDAVIPYSAFDRSLGLRSLLCPACFDRSPTSAKYLCHGIEIDSPPIIYNGCQHPRNLIPAGAGDRCARLPMLQVLASAVSPECLLIISPIWNGAMYG